MFTKKSLVIPLLATVVLFNGCQAVKEFNSLMGIPNTPKEYISKSGDKELATVFSKYMKTNNPSARRVSANSITLSEKHFSFSDYIEQYKLEDNIGQKFNQSELVDEYKDAILKRGNSFKVYKNAMNKAIIKAAYNVKKLKTWDDYSYFKYDWTPCIVEYTKNGKIKSVMVQHQEVFVAYNKFRDSQAPSKAESTVVIFTGYKASSLQNHISNNTFENNFLYGSNIK
ncbi:hypothetical protein [Poseidonibacter sp.]|uniref:hypothetical protein n=1 Tax=Poseidonibacter sp. TaxID=2321188 RepID=UPI003C739535